MALNEARKRFRDELFGGKVETTLFKKLGAQWSRLLRIKTSVAQISGGIAGAPF